MKSKSAKLPIPACTGPVRSLTLDQYDYVCRGAVTADSLSDQQRVLAEIDQVIESCQASETKSPDYVVNQELVALQRIRSIVEVSWPPPVELTKSIAIGGIAAKNLVDWNEPLATALMHLDRVLKTRGESLSKYGFADVSHGSEKANERH